MGDSACVMPAFSYTSGISNEASQGNPLQALGESVSFGRFMTESLAWDKWSTFSQKRHVEEAERYAQPGSVAQKKAFFEAHYKRIAAAKKAAALLEQENAATYTPDPEVKSSDCDDTTHDLETMRLGSQVAADEQKENFIVNADVRNSNAKPGELEIGKVGGAELATKPEVFVETATDLLNHLENVEDPNLVSGLESSGTSNIEKPLLKDATESVKKKRQVLSSLKSTVFGKVTSSPATSMLIPPLHPRKENSFTPSTIRSAIDSTDKKRSSPKSLRNFINFTPGKESNKLTSPDARKIEGSRIAPSSYKVSKDCATPLRTPTMASANGVPRHSSVTPSSENKRANTPFDPSAAGSKTGPKWHLISSVCSKSLSACRKKLQSSSLSTPFVLRTEERAARRKQKLEERFNEKEAQKVQKQTKTKEKAETEARKLRQTLCFRARPLPEFYREREISKKTPEMQPLSPKLGGKPNASKVQGTNPLTKSSTKAFKNFLKKK